MRVGPFQLSPQDLVFVRNVLNYFLYYGGSPKTIKPVFHAHSH